MDGTLQGIRRLAAAGDMDAQHRLERELYRTVIPAAFETWLAGVKEAAAKSEEGIRRGVLSLTHMALAGQVDDCEYEFSRLPTATVKVTSGDRRWKVTLSDAYEEDVVYAYVDRFTGSVLAPEYGPAGCRGPVRRPSGNVLFPESSARYCGAREVAHPDDVEPEHRALWPVQPRKRPRWSRPSTARAAQ